jgi:PAS domain S-box-containing protein
MDTELCRLLDALPAMIWTAGVDGMSNFVNRRWREYTGLTLEETLAAGWTSVYHPDDLGAALAAWGSTLAPSPPPEISLEARLRRSDGVYRRFKIHTRPLLDGAGRVEGWCGINADVEDQKRAEAQLAAEKRLLELVACGVELSEVLEELCVQVEELSLGSLCSILFVDANARHFRVGAGRTLPDAYSAVLDHLRIDPGYGPCSLAVETRSTIITADPMTDPRWRTSDWPKLIARFGLASCWSTPIFGSRDDVLGIFAIYRRKPQGPTTEERELIDQFAKIAGIAIERARSDLALKANAASLRRAHDDLAQAQKLSRTGSFTTDLDTGTHVWSDELYRILGFERGARPSFKAMQAQIHPDDQASFSKGLQKAIDGGTSFDMVFRLAGPESTLKYLHAVVQRVERSLPALFTGSIQDVTDSKVAESALARANAYLTATQRLTQTGSFTWDVATDEHNWSEIMYRIFGFEPGTMVTREMIRAAIHPEDAPQVETLIGSAINGQNFELVFRLVTGDGNIRHAQVVGHRIDQTPKRTVFMGALQDITARKLAESDLNYARAELIRVARVTALSAVTASIAHEVNQPLAGIITNASTCLRLLAMCPPNLDAAKATAERTIRDGNRAAEVIKRLRALYAHKPPSLEQVDLREAAREVLALSASELQRRGVILRTELGGEPATIEADRIQLQQVILNLVLNAADAMDDIEGRPRELRVACRAQCEGLISFEVCDSGPGINPLHVDQLFQPFHTTKVDGMGIGLSISRSIIEAHGGHLVAHSNKTGPGATFPFLVPSRDNSFARLNRGKRNGEVSAYSET